MCSNTNLIRNFLGTGTSVVPIIVTVLVGYLKTVEYIPSTRCVEHLNSTSKTNRIQKMPGPDFNMVSLSVCNLCVGSLLTVVIDEGKDSQRFGYWK